MSRRQTPIAYRTRSLPRIAAGGHRPLLLALAIAAGFAAGAARAQPTGAQAIHGSAVLSQQGSTLVVTTRNGAGSSHSAINWQSFSVPAGTATHFAQPGVTSTSINRVIGPDPSAIFGTLSSNGRLVLVNPAGIAVGAGAVVDTAGFTASTLRMSDADAIAGRLRFGDGSTAGPLRVDGQVLARSGDVVLIGTDVQAGAQAVIQSPEGATVLAAGQKVELTGRGLEGILFEVQAPGDRAVNLGTLRGDAVGVFAGTLRHSGLVQAQAVGVEGGRVVLKASDHAEAAGTTQAQGLAGAGGQVDLLGRTVGVMAGALIDTSNANGGGRIRIGGDYQGANPNVPNAQVTWIASDAHVRASATDKGDGGKVVVWADDTTRAHGRIEARGGANGGDGGFVETSGKRHLDVEGARVDASAAAGQAGRWLLDPSNITITAEPSDGNLAGSPQTPNFESADGGSSVLSVGTLNAAINGNTNVTVSTVSAGSDPGDIVFDASTADLQITKSTSGTTDLRLEADGQIRFTGSQFRTHFLVNDANDAGVLNVHLQANAASEPPVPQVVTDSGARVEFSTLGFPGNGNRLNVVLPAGKTWQNDGWVTLNLNSLLNLDGATFSNGSSGTLDGAAGPFGGIGGAGALGTFNNAGQSSLSEGAFRVAHLTNTGTFDLYNNTDLEVTQSFATTGFFGFNGRNLRIVQQSGLLDLGAGSGLWAQGAVELAALNGDLLVGRDLFGASVNLSAAGNVGFTNVDASGDGSMRMAGGPVSITAGGSVSGSSIFTPGSGWGEGPAGAGGNVDVTSANGSITLGSISAHGGGNGPAAGAAGGIVNLQAFGGVSVAEGVQARGGDGGQEGGAGGQGGTLRVRAGGEVDVAASDVSGGTARAGGSPGGQGGVVDIEGDTVAVMDVAAHGGGGGAGDSQGGAGGGGGRIALVQRSGTLDLSMASLDAGGGEGGSSHGASGPGGHGGQIQIGAQAGGVVLAGHATVAGGFGGHSDGAGSEARGGDGGNGGTVRISGTASSSLLGSLDASGSEGGYLGNATALGRGGNGGHGGTIEVELTGGASSVLELAGEVRARGGLVGEAYDDTTYMTDPARSGALGNTGSFTVSAGAIVVPSVVAPPEASPAPAQLQVDALWSHDTDLSIQSGATVTSWQSLANAGNLTIGSGASVGFHGGAVIGGSLNNDGDLSAGGGLLRSVDLVNGGSLMVNADTDLDVTRSFASAGSFDFYGRNLRIVQQSGPLVLGGGQGLWTTGSIELAAGTGDLQVQRDLAGASVALSAAGNIGFANLSTSADGSTRVAGGPVNVVAGGSVAGTGVQANGAGWSELAPGTGGAIQISAGGDIGLSGYIGAGGGSGSGGWNGAAGGSVTLQSTSGGVSVAGISANGGGASGAMPVSGGKGGTVLIRAAGDVVSGFIEAPGGYAAGPGTNAGGAGGVVDIEGGALYLAGINVQGAWGSDGGSATGGAGGAGGEVRLVQRSGSIELSQAWVNAEGGGGGSSSVQGGAGGRGGSIQVVAQGGGVQMTSGYGSLHARGGEGGYSDGAGAGARGGQGGQGGAIRISAAGSSALLGGLDASGGGGGEAGGTGIGGNGGQGGAIEVALGGSASGLSLAGDVHAGAGAPGLAWDGAISGYDPARTGASGAWGTFRAVAPGGIVVPSTMPYASPSPTGAPTMQIAGATEAMVPTELRMDAQWTNTAAVTLQSGATLMTTQPLVNEGTLDVAAGATVSLGHYDHLSETFVPGGVALVNAPAGRVQGSGTIDGDLANAGTVAPGGVGTVGALTVTGNFSQQPTGVLQMDIAADPSYVPGQTYDQLVVHGSAALDGQLQLAAVPATTTGPTASLLVAGATQLVATSPSPTTYYELLSASSASGQFSLISGPAELVTQIRMNVGGTALPVPGYTALPSPSATVTPIGEGLIAAIQEVLPGVSLEQIQQVVTESQNNATAAAPQPDDEDESQPEGSADIVVTDTACQPG